MPLIIALAGLLLSAGLLAQNNPYQIHDDCYQAMLKADELVGKEGFQEANETLLQTALGKNDQKAQVIYFVERLRDACARDDSEDSDVLSCQENLKHIAKSLGFEQYFYQSYQYASTYFFNHGQNLRALELMQEMSNIAIQDGSEYGKWLYQRLLAGYYNEYGTGAPARAHLAKTIQVYLSSGDPTLKRQSLSPFYLEYARTFPPSRADSIAYYLDRAEDAIVVASDSVRCAVERAKLAAAQGNKEQYKRYRDFCLNSPYKRAVGRYTAPTLQIIDTLLEGGSLSQSIDSVRITLHNLRVLSEVARNTGHTELALEFMERYAQGKENDIAAVMEANVAEMETRFKTARLEEEVATKNRQVERITRTVLILLTGFLLAALLALFYHTRQIEKSRGGQPKK